GVFSGGAHIYVPAKLGNRVETSCRQLFVLLAAIIRDRRSSGNGIGKKTSADRCAGAGVGEPCGGCDHNPAYCSGYLSPLYIPHSAAGDDHGSGSSARTLLYHVRSFY